MAPPAKPPSLIRETMREWNLPLLLVFALFLGGGGSPSPAMELALQLIFAALAMAGLWAGSFRSPAGRRAWVVAGLVVIVPVLQLFPLPPAVWSALPGRELVAGALELIGGQDQWHSASIAPHRTLASLLALGPPLVVLILTASSSKSQWRKAGWAIIAMAILAAILGAVQVSSAGTAGHFYEATHSGWVTGFFANRNAAADLFVIAIIAASTMAGSKASGQISTAPPAGALLVIALLLSVATLMTGSRVGIALLLVTVVCWGGWYASRGLRIAPRQSLAAGLAAIACFGVLTAVGWLAGGLRNVAARFSASGDMRAEIWPDTLHAIERFWPIGSGFGTFQQAFAPSQRLETLGPAMINRAHNDFLELALEGGPAALLILAVIAAVLAKNAFAQWRNSPANRAFLVFATGTLAVLALHSVVDYPLRTIALAVICAFGAGILAKPSRSS